MKALTKILLGVVVLFALILAIGLAAGPSPQENSTTTPLSLASSSTGVSSNVQNVKHVALIQSYQDSRYNFTVQVPAQWEIFRDPSQSSEEAAVGILPVLSVHPQPQDQTFGGSFVVSVDATSGATSSSLYDAIYKEKLAQLWSTYGITYDSVTNSTIGGIPASSLSYVIHFPSDLGGDCPVREFVVVHHATAYILGLNDCKLQEANEYSLVFANFASSFAFLA